jgi:hypothetical protein|tara:strand:- start:72 stop:206 length:135 start_codon:yes stop_codon:yes gene_type:complete
LIDAINTWWGECILQCGMDLTTLEIYLIMAFSLPIIVWLMERKK